MNIRKASPADFAQIWPIFHEVSSAGETYAYARNTTREQAQKLWMELGFETVGQLPKAFDHPDQGFVDALVMFKWLGDT